MEQTKMGQPIVSVLVPVFNVERYLERAVDSILAQSLKNIEIILIDDGSTDGSSRICQKKADEDTRVRFIKMTHAGVSAARNA